MNKLKLTDEPFNNGDLVLMFTIDGKIRTGVGGWICKSTGDSCAIIVRHDIHVEEWMLTLLEALVEKFQPEEVVR